MSEILFLAHRIPFPPDRGDKIRSHHILKRLAGLAPVHVATFVETAEDAAQEAGLAALAASHCVVRRSRPVPLATLEAMATGRPVSLTAFASARLRGYVAKVLRERPIGAIVVFSGQMAQYVPREFPGTVVMDFVDVDSAKFEDYAQRAAFPVSVLYRREARLLSAFEAQVAGRAACSLLATPEEAALFASRLPQDSTAVVRAMSNGIDAEFYDPAGNPGSAGLLRAGPHIVFTGQMDYPPNVEAVTFFAREVMPIVRKALGDAHFHIVGRAPTTKVESLDGTNGTSVTGAVPDVRPWIARADLIVAPLLIARGVQNKVLEAMAMGRPVLATSAAATGIGARNGVELAVADGAEALASRAVELLEDGEEAGRMGLAARAFVMREKAWDAVLAPLDALCRAKARPRNAA
ncbi:MAG: TIGR03087 family PEP-CTERM/XrtA system glycosyltransferase [Sphingomonadales bacterium]|nr:TIGR03087 family PEP-CTERM/XrtA system glycosyltransferase [Sphingomonadales bacterium]MDE2570068.1 TIGR03087 family PEP-CTERM/XrtA system glycosyltransferase [Sphingomonadales bacterium]